MLHISQQIPLQRQWYIQNHSSGITMSSKYSRSLKYTFITTDVKRTHKTSFKRQDQPNTFLPRSPVSSTGSFVSVFTHCFESGTGLSAETRHRMKSWSFSVGTAPRAQELRSMSKRWTLKKRKEKRNGKD